MSFTIPHKASAAFADQAQVDSVDLEILLTGLNNRGVIRGCAVFENAGMQLNVAAGYVQLSTGLAAAISAATPTHDAADGSNPRFDVVVIDSSATVQIRKGTAAASNPAYPTLTAGDIPLAAVYIPAGDTTITNSQIIDKRIVTWGPVFVEKTANESVTSSTTLQNDDHLRFEVGANEDWIIECLVYYTAPWNNGDFKAAWTHPTGSTFRWTGWRMGLNVTASWGNANSAPNQAGTSGTVLSGGGAYSGTITGSGEVQSWTMRGFYEGGANAGTLQLQWAQVNSDTESDTVRIGSTLRARRIT